MIKRISVRFNTDFKEDKELLETLEKKRNQNGYIKMALKNFVSGTNLDPFLAESIGGHCPGNPKDRTAGQNERNDRNNNRRMSG